MDKIIHYCDYASQPDIKIACNESWTTPAYHFPKTGIQDVYLSDDNRLYTFDEELVTCKQCKDKCDICS